jgi:hypothetical protein
MKDASTHNKETDYHSVADMVEEWDFLSSPHSKMKGRPGLPDMDEDEKELLNLLTFLGVISMNSSPKMVGFRSFLQCLFSLK